MREPIKANSNPFSTEIITTIPGASSSAGEILSRKINLNIKRKPATPKTNPTIIPTLFFIIDNHLDFKIYFKTNVSNIL